jgi:drug/metabolite transporter (DMT)-like permease
VKNLSPFKKAGLFVVFAALSGEIANAFVRPASIAFDPLLLACLRIFVAVIVVGLLFRKEINFRKFWHLPLKAWALVFLIGAVFWATAIYFLTTAVTHANLANVSFIISQQPIIVFMFSFLFLHSQFDLKKLGLILLSVYGVLVLGTGSFNPRLESFGVGETFALISAFAAAAGFIGRKALTGYLNAVETSVSTMFFAALTLLAFSIFSGQDILMPALTPMVLSSLIGGGATMALTSVFNNKAIDLASPIFVTQIGLAKVLFASLLGLSFFGELLPPAAVIGGIIVVVSVYLSVRPRGSSIAPQTTNLPAQ